MSKIFPNLKTRATAYAAYKELENMLKEDGEIPPGAEINVSGNSITITLPPDTIVKRDPGLNGDGTILKKATQNLYGWAILFECFRIVRLFKHHKKLERVLMMIVRRAVKNAVSSETAFKQLMPKRAEEIQSLRDSLPVPKREEPTPRKIVKPENARKPTLAFKTPA